MINSLATYARINEYGFIEAPYRKIDKSDPKNPRVTDEVVYMTADEEDNYHVAQANEALDAEGHFVRNSVSGRYREETQEYEKTMFDYMTYLLRWYSLSQQHLSRSYRTMMQTVH